MALSPAAASDPVLGGLPAEFPALHWHGDVFELPPGAVHLARSALTENQAFRSGAALGLLFHLEAGPGQVAAMARAFGSELASAGVDPAALRADTERLAAAASRSAARSSGASRAWCREGSDADCDGGSRRRRRGVRRAPRPRRPRGGVPRPRREPLGLRADGLRVHGPGFTREVRPFASDDAAELAARGPFDAVLVAVKAWQVRDLAPSLRPLVGPETVVVPLQNGVEAADHLEAALGEGPVALGLCHVFAWLEAPGVARTSGTPLRITVGLRSGARSARLERLAGALREAGIEAVLAPDAQAALWEKFLFIDPFGGVGAVTRSPLGSLRAVPESRELLAGAMEEVASLARARGVRIAGDAVARTMAQLDRLPPESTASMQRDIVQGRPSELHDQPGAVVRLAGASGVSVPVHRFLYAALLPQEIEARRRAAAGAP